ncbi:speriolin-like protein [Melanotaenia boesemani]|uniref:speriolin-like protein n=1 Tax=Melanotaenia boesemani TaxID=1250792 RepID=UPI001C04BFD0|nr:speriolin-like protein [Melanotaenia boesemani]
MDLGYPDAVLQAQNEHLMQENGQLRAVLSLLKENVELKSMMQSFNNHTRGEFTVSGIKSSTQMQNTFDEQVFKKDLQPTKSKHEPRTSSPINFKSFLQSSACKDTDEAEELQKCQTESPLCDKGLQKLLGEIAFQLDRRILSHIFQACERFYGFSVLRIPEKIIDVSTHPLTGKVDKGYQLYLTERYEDLMDKLSQLGYKQALHPLFSEFIVNTFGILKDRLSKNSPQWADYNNSDFVRKVIVTTAPSKLQKDLLLVLDCLCCMAASDKKPLLYW